MTRFRKWARTQGLRLEQDYEYLPCGDIDCVVVVDGRAQVSAYHYGLGWVHWCYDRSGALTALTREQENEATRAAVYKVNRRCM